MKTIRLINVNDTITLTTDAPTTINGAVFSINSFTVSPYKPRLGVQSRYGKSGGVATGDREVDPREIQIGLDLTTTDNSDYNYIQAMDTILGFFRPENAPFYIYDDQDDAGTGSVLPRRAKVELQEENLSSEVLERRHMSGQLIFVMLDGTWEDQTVSSYESASGGVVTGETFGITNTTNLRAFPIYTLTALSNNTLFKLSNTTTNVFIEIGTSNFTIGNDIIINTINGTILVDGVDIAATSLSDGSSFPDLLPGLNTMKYESSLGGVVIDVEWRERYPR